MSIAGGATTAIHEAIGIGATTFQLFLKNNNQWQGKPISEPEAALFRSELAEARFAAPPVAHSGYLINLASPDPVTGPRSVGAMIDELRRADQLGVPGVVVHPGAHVGQGEAAGLAAIAERINHILDVTSDGKSAIWLETTAGQGSCLGHRFEHLAELIDRTENKTRLGVCLDTCHVFAAGYDLRTANGVMAMLKEFDRIIGLDWLRVIHVNDSLKPFASRVDRHAHIGQGEIGEDGFSALIRDRRLSEIPFILETPKGKDLAEDRMNLATLRRLVGQVSP